MFVGAGDLVAKRGASAESAAGPPYSSLAGLRRPRPSLRRAWVPDLDKVLVALLCLPGDVHFLITQFLHMVGMVGAGLLPFCGGLPACSSMVRSLWASRLGRAHR